MLCNILVLTKVADLMITKIKPKKVSIYFEFFHNEFKIDCLKVNKSLESSRTSLRILI
jgi:hypothetical protein